MFKRIPLELFFKIFARLPVKSLLQSRRVCKSWNALISSPSFVSAHLDWNARKSAGGYGGYLLISTSNAECLSLFCAQTYVKCLDFELPRDLISFGFSVFSSCSDLVCISDATFDNCTYLWNPSIRKMKRPQMPHLLHAIRYHYTRCIREAEVYSLRLDSWRRIRSSVPPVSHNAYFQDRSACLNGVVYWIVEDFSPRCYSILSFDLRSESFQTMTLPERLVIFMYSRNLSLFHLRQNVNDRYCNIWVLGRDTWKMIRTIILPRSGEIAWPLGITTKDEVHLAAGKENWHSRELVLYDPKSQQVKDTGIELSFYGLSRYIEVYNESLVLLD
ncbi:F-box/kelch-repeat protein [Pyrus ussuriensis x Pyrus communis]|uniref:F-box/kelch-repeat protein n=1 Tax=Pyrus ussuriensis x Pyrus communis TaxID=2448454 RepID=A0A5N5I8W9_9ROSA|nr:F-box/kelch-repeat protein [Pyrus ussuriensis x Pyrus communis]